MKKLVLTGAAGRLGSWLREPLNKLCDELVSTDIVEDIGTCYPGERYIKADLSVLDEIVGVLEGADMVVHFGAVGDEAPFDDILQSNIVGAYTVWEAAYRQGVPEGEAIRNRTEAAGIVLIVVGVLFLAIVTVTGQSGFVRGGASAGTLGVVFAIADGVFL